MRDEAAFVTGFVLKALHAPAQGRVAWKVPAELRKGLPDVWYSLGGGWIEAKYVKAWPKRPGTPVTVEVTAEQLAHLRQCAGAGRPAWVLVGVGPEWFLFAWSELMPFDRLSRALMEGLAACRGRIGAPGRRALVAYLSR